MESWAESGNEAKKCIMTTGFALLCRETILHVSGGHHSEGLIVKTIFVVLLQLVARSCEERYQEVMKELQALKKVKKKLGNLEEEIGSLHNTNKVRLVA